jgi:hypothetical protein
MAGLIEVKKRSNSLGLVSKLVILGHSSERKDSLSRCLILEVGILSLPG